MSPARVTRTRGEARAAYDRLSRWYDLFSGGERRLGLDALRLLAPRPGERVLEIGPGTGHALRQLASAVGLDGLACGLDLSPGMLARARRRAPGSALVQADGLFPPFVGGSFDLIFLSFTLELFDTPEIPAVLAECARLLRPGGRLGVVALAKCDGLMVNLYEKAHSRWPAVIDCRPIHAAQAVREAGFTVRESQVRSLWGLPVEVVIAARNPACPKAD